MMLPRERGNRSSWRVRGLGRREEAGAELVWLGRKALGRA